MRIHTRRTSSCRRLATVVVAGALIAFGTVAALVPTAAVALPAGSPLSLPYPRLSVWWPDTVTQSPAQLARYDWLALGEWDRHALPSIRALNPDEILLTSTDACEVNCDPSQDASAAENSQIAKVSARWILTQVGATLTQPVDAATTVLPVSAVSGADANGAATALFVPGDTVVLDDEIAQVTVVNASARTLTVRRGVVKAAAPHAPGARVAATISFWPKSVVMDLTSACPRVAVDSNGPENWAEYNARLGAQLTADDSWDGIVVDWSGSRSSWLVGKSTARSIDPDRTNRFPTDGYAAFDDSWGLGVLGYELRLRAGVGDDKLMVSNWGAPNYSVMNGNNFEGFPNADSVAFNWRNTTVGPSLGDGSYFEWLANARQPNLSTIQTYEDDSAASPTSDGGYSNPASKPGFVPNYKKMRYGLTTALMGDGFFSYEINTNGQGALGLLWFDEFDGAGRGRGYLGQPTGPAHPVWDPLPAPDLIGGAGAFDNAAQYDSWIVQVNPAAAAQETMDAASPEDGPASMKVSVTKTDGIDWHVKAYHPVSISRGREYTLTFWARSDATKTVDAWIQQATAPYDNLDWLGATRVTPQWTKFTLTATATGTAKLAWAVLALGTSTGDVWIDDVKVQEGNPDVWRREFANGIALVNATNSPVTVPLGGYFRKLRGAQAPAINDGSLVNAVTLAAHDGIVLLRTGETGPSDAALARERTSAALAAARSHSNSAAVKARAAYAAYARLARRGSRRARQRASAAAVSWKLAAARASAATASIAKTQAWFSAGNPSFQAALASTDAAAAAAAKAARYACTEGAGAAANSARSHANLASQLLHTLRSVAL